MVNGNKNYLDSTSENSSPLFPTVKKWVLSSKVIVRQSVTLNIQVVQKSLQLTKTSKNYVLNDRRVDT